MKKKFIFLITLFVFSSFSISYGFVNQRYDWWKIRLKNLNIEKEKLINNSIEKTVLPIIENDIERARYMLGAFENNGENTTNNYSKKKYNKTEIKKLIKKIFSPMFNLHYFEGLVNNVGEKNNYKITKSIVNQFLKSLIHKKFGRNDFVFRREIVTANISKNDWRYLCLELILGERLLNIEASYNSALSYVEKGALIKSKKNNFYFSLGELKDYIESIFNDYLESGSDKNPAHYMAALKTSWRWKSINASIENDFNRYNKIIAMFNKIGHSVSLLKIRQFFLNPERLAKLYFNTLSEYYKNTIREIKDRTLQKKSFKKARGEEIPGIQILDEIDPVKIILDIDNYRKTKQRQISGKEGAEFFKKLTAESTRIIEKYVQETRRKFDNEDNRLRITAEKHFAESNGKQDVENIFLNNNFYKINDENFEIAKWNFEEKVDLFHSYCYESIIFLRFLSGSKKINTARISKNFKYRLNRNQTYIQFLESLALKCCRLALFDSLEYRNRIYSSIKRASNIFSLVGYSLAFNKKLISNLDGEKIKELNKIKTDVAEYIKTTRSELKEKYVELLKHQRKKNNRILKPAKSFQEKIANLEIEIFLSELNEYEAKYSSLNYNKKALLNYYNLYFKLQDDIKNGNKSKKINYVLNKQTIFPLVKSFNKQNLTQEYEFKKYLRNLLRKDMARLKTLINIYKRDGILIDDFLIIEKFKAIRKKIKTNESVTIDNWVMNETNFEKIDKNAVQKLMLIARRSIWKNDKNSKNLSKNQNEIINLKNYKISLSIPDGWIEQNLNYKESNNGIIKQFKSIDGKSTICLASIESNGKNEKDAAEIWLKKMKSKKVKQKWGKNKKFEYFWTLSNCYNQDVMEVYTILYGTQMLVLSGASSRLKYNFFKSKMDSVFESISSSL